ncbi:STAS domain-containing protein [Streptomyces sp. WG-D5]
MTSYAALSVTRVGATDGVLTLRVAGTLDYDTSGALAEHVERALAEHPVTRVLLLDCAGLDSIDSMGLSVLLSLRRRLDGLGAALRLTPRSARLDRLLDVTGTFGHLIGESSAAEADEEAGGRDAEPAHREDTSR